jgi:FXSXX-COOH protein
VGEPRAEAADVESELVDLGRLRLSDLPDLDEQVLAPVMRRVLRRADDPESITSGYNPQRLD